jgi:hypothetical protein
MAPPLRILIVFGADTIVPLAVIAGLSRPKDGVASLAYVSAIPITSDCA